MAIALALLALVALLGLAALLADGLRAIYRRHRAGQAGTLHLLVTERREQAGHLLCLSLRPVRGRRLPPFAAGQHLLLRTPPDAAGATVQRAYSLAAWQAQPTRYELGIKRETPGRFSQWAWQHLRPGRVITCSLPQGHFVLTGSSGPLVLIGGGIGITPLRAMVHQALAAGRPLQLFHAARQADELLYTDEFRQLAAAHPHFVYRPLLSRPAPGWTGERGRLDAARVLRDLAEPAATHFYLCAGQSLLAALHAGLGAAGIAAENIHHEAFGVAGTGSSGQRIEVECSGQSLTLHSAGEPNLLATLEAHQAAPPSECRAGSCGRCVMRLTAGTVDWLLAPEYRCPDSLILPCVCRPGSDLRLVAVDAQSVALPER